MCECQPLSWDKDDIEFALDIIQEADAMMSDVLVALTWVQSDTLIWSALKKNIQRIYRRLSGQPKGKITTKITVNLMWPPIDPEDRHSAPTPDPLLKTG